MSGKFPLPKYYWSFYILLNHSVYFIYKGCINIFQCHSVLPVQLLSTAVILLSLAPNGCWVPVLQSLFPGALLLQYHPERWLLELQTPTAIKDHIHRAGICPCPPIFFLHQLELACHWKSHSGWQRKQKSGGGMEGYSLE